MKVFTVLESFKKSKSFILTPIYSYFENKQLPLEISLKFIEKFPINSPLPIKKYISYLLASGTSLKISNNLKSKINKRIKRYSSLDAFCNEIKDSQIGKENNEILSKRETVKDILNDENIPERYKLLYICKHIKEFPIKDINDLTKNILYDNKEGTDINKNVIKSTVHRKYFFAYGLLIDGVSEKI